MKPSPPPNTGSSPSLPPELLRYFDRFGRGLHEGEAMEFARSNGQTASLTPATRERLLRASQAESWTEETTLKGRIPEVDQADHGFELELRNGTKLKAPLLEAHRKTVLEAAVGYRTGMTVAIKGVIERIAPTAPGASSRLSTSPHWTRWISKPALKNWRNCKTAGSTAKAEPRIEHHSFVWRRPSTNVLARTPFAMPHLYPTPEGGVQAEWTLGPWEISLEITLSNMAADYQAVHTATGETRGQTLLLAAEDGTGWAALNEALAQLQEAQA